MIGKTVSHYRIIEKLGQGGMGIVYSAHDERLSRSVAIKMISGTSEGIQLKERFWREARAAASINHPSICQIYEIGEDKGELFIAMELLQGESLAARIARSPLPMSETIQISLSLLAVLEVLHQRQLVHRDLKPSNVFLTMHGIKLLDFGLTCPSQVATSETDSRLTSQLTQPGTVVGSPHYMSPEQLSNQPVDARSDLFAVGAILFEMLTGKYAFPGGSMIEVYHAIMYEQPPALGGSPAIAAVDRVVHGALAKKPQDRYPTAGDMAQALRTVLLSGDATGPQVACPMARLMVLPFRILRPDSETDFLAFSLPDAITSSLSGLESIVVRSSAAAARFRSDTPDLKSIAAEADVDIVLTGTLLRAGEQLRVNAQLMEVPGGSLIWSQTSQVALGDIFQLQDNLTRRIVESLSLPLTAREQRLLKHDVPSGTRAYEFFLRANQLSTDSGTWDLACSLYLQCLEEDPRYAPAWARLGRVYRLLGKYLEPRSANNLASAEEALHRALAINPELGLAHNLYAQLEVELGRAQAAMVRLLERAQQHTNDAELFAGLVHSCRYCGLLDASVAAHQEALRLDPAVKTTVSWTYWILGQYREAMAASPERALIFYWSLVALGREEEAIPLIREEELKCNTKLRDFYTASRTLLEGKHSECFAAIERISNFSDPEGLYQLARWLAHLGQNSQSLAMLRRVAAGGYFCFPLLARDPWLDPLRTHGEFNEIIREIEDRHREALAAFLEAGGSHLLGMSPHCS